MRMHLSLHPLHCHLKNISNNLKGGNWFYCLVCIFLNYFSFFLRICIWCHSLVILFCTRMLVFNSLGQLLCFLLLKIGSISLRCGRYSVKFYSIQCIWNERKDWMPHLFHSIEVQKWERNLGAGLKVNELQLEIIKI